MKITKTLHVTNRTDWRKWLEKHFDTEKEIWLVYYKKHTGKPRVSYDDAVEEALCFGWIDSTVKKIDDEKYCQKYTPRNKNSNWSESNLKRARKMVKEGLMTDAGLVKLKAAFANEKQPGTQQVKQLIIPTDLKKALAADKDAEKNFNNLPPSHKRHYLNWLNEARREETRARRIKQTVIWVLRKHKPGMDMKMDT